MLDFFCIFSYVKLVGATSQIIKYCELSLDSFSIIDSIVRRDYGRVASHLESNLETLEFVSV